MRMRMHVSMWLSERQGDGDGRRRRAWRERGQRRRRGVDGDPREERGRGRESAEESPLLGARGGLERCATGRCREAYRARASLGWTSRRQREMDL